MKKRSEVGVEGIAMRIAKQFAKQTARVVKHRASQAVWRGPKGARPVTKGRARALTARRAPVGSTHSVFASIGGRSSLFMNNPG